MSSINKKSVHIRSIGCRTNQEEMAALSSELITDGYSIVGNNDSPDIIIINSCSVTATAESKSLRLISSLAHKNPKSKICITGCLAQQNPNKLKQHKQVAWVVGNSKKQIIPKILLANDGIFHTNLSRDPSTIARFERSVDSPKTSAKTRFALKIQEGCDLSCSYCIVPQLRGPSRSIDCNDIYALAQRAINNGFKELVITGTHIGQYKDSTKKKLPDLLDLLLSISGEWRLRISSIDPRECSDDLLAIIAGNRRVCKHLHLSIQSLSPSVLSRMHRNYNNLEQFISKIISIKKTVPNLGLGADIIVGFPGESNKEFEETLSMISYMDFNYGHVFRFSPRPNTVAATMDKQCDEVIKSNRSELLRNQLASQRKDFIEKQVNSNLKHIIISESIDPIKGITDNYIRVVMNKKNIPKNTMLSVKLTGYNSIQQQCSAIPATEKCY